MNKYCVPRIAWGRFVPRDGRIEVPFAVEANHAFVDGLHMAQLIGAVQRNLDAG